MKDKLHWSQILVNTRSKLGRRESTSRLRRAMLESGRPYICALCKCLPKWQEKILILQIDHIDGDNCNSEPDNVRFLCPNCHSQTPNFGAKNKNRLTELDIDNLYAWTGEYEEFSII